MLWGASTVLGKFVLNKVNFKVMTGLRFSIAFIFLILLNWQQRSFPNFAKFTVTDVLFILTIAVASGVVSLLIYYRGLEGTKASVATIAELGFPMAAVIINWIFLDASLAPMKLAGMVIILFALFKLS